MYGSVRSYHKANPTPKAPQIDIWVLYTDGFHGLTPHDAPESQALTAKSMETWRASHDCSGAAPCMERHAAFRV